MTQERGDIHRQGCHWSREEFEQRLADARPEIPFGDGLFASKADRCVVLGLLLQNLGIDTVVRFGNLADWKAAIADLEQEKIGKSL